MKFIPILCVFLAGCASRPKIPPNIVPKPDLSRPHFQILSVKEHRSDTLEGPPGQIRKLYAIDVMEHGKLWRIIINRDNETVGQLKLSGP